MSAQDKLANTAETAKSKVKEGLGKATGNASLEAEGRGCRAKGGLKQAGEKIEDVLRNRHSGLVPDCVPSVARDRPLSAQPASVPAQQVQAAPSRETARIREEPPCLSALEPS
jgi:uncharacterized protein YjbJ (UPF0337 family)